MPASAENLPPNLPMKRGRGCPRKALENPFDVSESIPKRPVGRPRKTPVVLSDTSENIPKRPVGRPRKVAQTQHEVVVIEDDTDENTTPILTGLGTKRALPDTFSTNWVKKSEIITPSPSAHQHGAVSGKRQKLEPSKEPLAVPSSSSDSSISPRDLEDAQLFFVDVAVRERKHQPEPLHEFSSSPSTPKGQQTRESAAEVSINSSVGDPTEEFSDGPYVTKEWEVGYPAEDYIALDDDDEPPLLDEMQASIVELAAEGRNIFYTGSAGTGKSTVLSAIKSRLEEMGKTVEVLAPTGKAALAVGGQTTWTFAGLPVGGQKNSLHTLRTLQHLRGKAQRKLLRRRFQDTDVIIIDEISMVENLHFERLNEMIKTHRHVDELGKQAKAFGGMQVIVTGDFCQLPPVGPFRNCIHCGSGLMFRKVYTCRNCPTVSYHESDKWAFRSEAWKECNFVHKNLTAIHRQKDDHEFIRLLQKCRVGQRFSNEEIDLLMQNRNPEDTGVIKIFPRNADVARINAEETRKLATEKNVYKSFDNFKIASPSYDENGPACGYGNYMQARHRHNAILSKYTECSPDGATLTHLKDHSLPAALELRKGMAVVLLTNLNLHAGLANGSQGTIIGFEDHDPAKLPQLASADNPHGLAGPYAVLRKLHIQHFASTTNNKPRWPRVRFANGRERTIYPDCNVKEVSDFAPYPLLCRTQIPLAASWALTIHKAQGMTLDRVVVDLSGSFEEGQVYVALSRATSLRGLRVDGDRRNLMGFAANREVLEFLREKGCL